MQFIDNKAMQEMIEVQHKINRKKEQYDELSKRVMKKQFQIISNYHEYRNIGDDSMNCSNHSDDMGFQIVCA